MQLTLPRGGLRWTIDRRPPRLAHPAHAVQRGDNATARAPRGAIAAQRWGKCFVPQRLLSANPAQVDLLDLTCSVPAKSEHCICSRYVCVCMVLAIIDRLSACVLASDKPAAMPSYLSVALVVRCDPFVQCPSSLRLILVSHASAAHAKFPSTADRRGHIGTPASCADARRLNPPETWPSVCAAGGGRR